MADKVLMSATTAGAGALASVSGKGFSPAGRRRRGGIIGTVAGGALSGYWELSTDNGTTWFRFGTIVTVTAGVNEVRQFDFPFTCLIRFYVTAHTTASTVKIVMPD